MTAIVLALMCAVSYGVADFWGGLATRRGSIWKVLPIIVATGIVTLAIAVPFFGATFSQGAILAGVAAGISGTIGYIFIMYGLALGPMSVVAPISAVIGAIIPFAVGFWRGETLSTVGFIGAGLAFISIVMLWEFYSLIKILLLFEFSFQVFVFLKLELQNLCKQLKGCH